MEFPRSRNDGDCTKAAHRVKYMLRGASVRLRLRVGFGTITPAVQACAAARENRRGQEVQHDDARRFPLKISMGFHLVLEAEILIFTRQVLKWPLKAEISLSRLGLPET